MPAPCCFNNPAATLTSLPPELRRIIYSHVFDDLAIRITRTGSLDTTKYRHQISVVSRLLRSETLPILRNLGPSSLLRLICEDGKFPDAIRRCIPNYVLHSIRVIVIRDSIKYDELKISRFTFPNLSLLDLDIERLIYTSEGWHSSLGQTDSPSEKPGHYERFLAEQLLWQVRERHLEQERPREGLERDYLVEGTLWEVLLKTPRSRGFDVTGRLRYVAPKTEVRYQSRGGKIRTVELDMEDSLQDFRPGPKT